MPTQLAETKAATTARDLTLNTRSGNFANMAEGPYSQANAEYVNENYQRAIELYSEALQKEKDHEEALCSRAQAYLKLDRLEDAVKDCDAAIEINPKCFKAFFRKGVALYNAKDYQKALDAFREAKTLGESVDDWLKKCEAELAGNKHTNGCGAASAAAPGDHKAAAAQADPVPMPSGPKTRYEWYQTHTHVVITILLKNAKEEDLTCIIHEKSLSVTVRQPSGSDYSLELDLAHPILPDQSSHRLFKTKIEIKLKKLEGIQWTKLEYDGKSKPAPLLAAPGSAAPSQYPSSRPAHIDWNKLERDVIEEEKEEKKEGDAALNSLFQQIYADGTDEVKKAMVKSFYESGGTVLSTNWNEVKQKEVEVKPPDGVEYKKWNQ